MGKLGVFRFLVTSQGRIVSFEPQAKQIVEKPEYTNHPSGAMCSRSFHRSDLLEQSLVAAEICKFVPS